MIRKASPDIVREAIEDALAGLGGSRLEATEAMTLADAEELASRVLVEKHAGERVRLLRYGPWLEIEPVKKGPARLDR